MRISDWSSDVCSSDLRYNVHESRYGHMLMSICVSLCLSGASCQSGTRCPRLPKLMDSSLPAFNSRLIWSLDFPASLPNSGTGDRKSVVEGKSVAVRVDLGGRRIIKKKKEEQIQ